MSIELPRIRDQYAACGFPAEDFFALRTVQTGRLVGTPYLTLPAGEPAIGAWFRFRAAREHVGRSPLLRDSAEGVPPMHEIYRKAFPSDSKVIAEAEHLDDGHAWMQSLIHEMDKWRQPGEHGLVLLVGLMQAPTAK